MSESGDINKLGFSLKMTFERKEHNIPLEKPRLKKDKKEGKDTHPQLIGKRVLIEGSCEGELVFEANEEFNKYFEEYGKILQPTKYEKYKGTDVLNSKRSLVIDINDDIQIPRLIEYEGMNTGNKDRLRVYYSGNQYSVEGARSHTQQDAQRYHHLHPQGINILGNKRSKLSFCRQSDEAC